MAGLFRGPGGGPVQAEDREGEAGGGALLCVIAGTIFCALSLYFSIPLHAIARRTCIPHGSRTSLMSCLLYSFGRARAKRC